MASTPVRWLRILIGACMVVWGFTETTTTGYIVGTIGVFPMFGGLYDFCVLAPLFGGPLSGRAALHPTCLP
jgi:hypothetical protein